MVIQHLPPQQKSASKPTQDENLGTALRPTRPAPSTAVSTWLQLTLARAGWWAAIGLLRTSGLLVMKVSMLVISKEVGWTNSFVGGSLPILIKLFWATLRV